MTAFAHPSAHSFGPLRALLAARRRTTAWVVSLSALLLVYASWQLFHWGLESARPVIGDLFFFPVSIAATLTAWRASRRASAWPRLQRAWRLLAFAAFAYLLGDLVQTGYELIGVKPYPSVGDVLYLSFYPLMLAGLLSFPVLRRSRAQRVRLALDLSVVALAGFGAVVYVVLGPTALAESGSLVQAVFSLAYPVGDMVLLVGLGSVLLQGSAPSARKPLQLLGIALGLYVVGDLIYGYVTLHSTYHGGDRVDTFWILAISIMAVAAVLQRRIDAPEKIPATVDRVPWLPYGAVAFGFSALLFSDRHDSFFPGLTMTLIAMALVALVSGRQFLSQRDLLRAQGELRHQALHDALTSLPNRLLVLDRLAHLLTRSHRHGPISVLFVDVDGFKQVNDTFGHAAGDELLKVLSNRLVDIVPAGDTVGRLGGDEFVILLDPESSVVPPELIAERILAVLRQPVDLNGSGRSFSITVSIGIAVGPRVEAAELLRDADIALYRAKGTGRDRFVVFETKMHAEVEDRLWLEMDLVEAIEQRQFFLEYQPTFDLRSRTITGVEALVRWRHPARGVLAPNLFVPAAEETGLIVPLGRWVLEEACRQAADWHRRGYPIRVAVNVSARQLEDDCFVSDVAEVLRRSGFDPAALTLEITETALMRDAVAAAERLRLLKALGLRIAVDDFGTGYSSLAYLRQFPVDALKIDRAFVSGLALSDQSGALVHTLVQLGKSLGLETVGEGIETPAQLEQLRQEGCDSGQGFLLARPLALAVVDDLLAASFFASPVAVVA